MKFSIVTYIISVSKFHAIKTFGLWKFILSTNLWKWIIAKMVGGFPRHKRSSMSMHLTITIMNKILRSIMHVCVPFIMIHECMMGLGFLALALKSWALKTLAFKGLALAFKFLRILVLESWALKLSQGMRDEEKVALINLGGLDDVEALLEKISPYFKPWDLWLSRRWSKVSFPFWNLEWYL